MGVCMFARACTWREENRKRAGTPRERVEKGCRAVVAADGSRWRYQGTNVNGDEVDTLVLRVSGLVPCVRRKNSMEKTEKRARGTGLATVDPSAHDRPFKICKTKSTILRYLFCVGERQLLFFVSKT